MLLPGVPRQNEKKKVIQSPAPCDVVKGVKHKQEVTIKFVRGFLSPALSFHPLHSVAFIKRQHNASMEGVAVNPILEVG